MLCVREMEGLDIMNKQVKQWGTGLVLLVALLVGGIWWYWPEPVETAAAAERAQRGQHGQQRDLVAEVQEREARLQEQNVASTVSGREQLGPGMTQTNNAEQRRVVEAYAAYKAWLPEAPGTPIASFQTSLAGNDAEGRVKNIRLANEKLNGRILMPGDVLSFNQTLGDSNDPRAGWQLATVIVGKTYAQGYGGGICQVSSTLYNSVLQAGLKVKERYTHSLPVGYVRPGQDATVSYPELDFKFQNSLQVPVRISATVVNGNVVCTISTLPGPNER